MKKLITLLLLLLCTGAVAVAQDSKPKKATDLTAAVPVDKKVRLGHLDNGFTYYIRANKKPENRVQFRLVTNAGSVLEDEDQLGLAHFCEHMAFNGTQYFKGNEMISKLQENGIVFGGGINAWTAFDETVYYVDMPSDKPDMIEMGFKILDGWAGKLLFDQKEIDAERGVILEEWRRGLGSTDRLRKATWPTMLKGAKYADRLPIGTEEVLRTFDRKTITRFYNDWYRPDLQAIIIVGDINVDEMEAKVKQYFASYAKRENPRERVNYSIPDNKEPLVAIATDKEATSATLQMFWKHPKAHQGTVGDYRQSLVRQLVNGMISDRFSVITEKATCPAMYADGGYSGFLARDGDCYALAAAPKEGRIEECAEMLLTEMKRLDQHGFLAPELERQKESLLARYKKMAKEENKTNNVSFAQEYTNHFLEGEVIPGIRQEYRYAQEFVPEITLEEVNQMVATWITDENFVFYLTAPDSYTVPTEKQVLDLVARVKQAQTEPWVDNFKDEPLFDRQLAEAKYEVTKVDDALGYKEYTVQNGVRFVVKQTELKADEIQMQSYAFGGLSLYDDEAYLNASMAASFIDEAGIGDFTSTQLQKKLQGKIVGTSPYVNELTQGINGSCSPADLETLLQLTVLAYTSPRRDQESFDRLVNNLSTQFKLIEVNPKVPFIRRMNDVAYGGSIRTQQIPTIDQIQSLKLDDMWKVYTERFADASNLTFFFVGNVSDKDISLIANYLNALPCNGKQKQETWRDRTVKMTKGVNRETVYAGTDNQGMLYMMGETEGFEPTYENRMIIQQLGDAIEITALEEIREKMGGTYSPMVDISYDFNPGMNGKVEWVFAIDCDPDNAANIEAAIVKIIKQYQKKGPSKKTLAKVKEQMLSTRETQMQNNGFWMGQIYGGYYYGENRALWVTRYADYVNAVNAKQVQAAAVKYLDLNHFTLMLLKPEQAK